jgi:tetratricopeptide (TPR) repeat protein
MSSEHEQLKPIPFEVAAPPPQEGPVRPAVPWVLPALGLLLALALAVIFWLPDRVSAPQPGSTTPTSENAPADVPEAQTPGKAGGAARGTDASPWSEAQLAKLRKEAQDVLAELLDVQFALEERGVTQWAPEPFAAATAAASAGDELYRQREYIEAKKQYGEALGGLQRLRDSVPGVMAAQLATAREAIENLDREAAEAALALATLLEPESAELAAMQRRVDGLEQLVPLLQQAAEAEQRGDLAMAEQRLQEASTLDPAHEGTAAELARVAAAHLEQRFNDAMSEGYSALDEARFDEARQAFRRAGSLREGSSEVSAALQEVETAATAYRLASLKRRGAALEGQEQWQEAVDAYEQAEKLDANVLFAREGLQRSRSRARLDQQFRKAIEQPGRLSDVAVAEATEQLLRKAENISPRGPVLAAQIDSLRTLLQRANTKITVTLRSDEQTEVIVYKVARLGRFQEKSLTLRPGTYTAVGTRIGYRDVRRVFTVSHDSAQAPVLIACTEPI